MQGRIKRGARVRAGGSFRWAELKARWVTALVRNRTVRRSRGIRAGRRAGFAKDKVAWKAWPGQPAWKGYEGDRVPRRSRQGYNCAGAPARECLESRRSRRRSSGERAMAVAGRKPFFGRSLQGSGHCVFSFWGNSGPGKPLMALRTHARSSTSDGHRLKPWKIGVARALRGVARLPRVMGQGEVIEANRVHIRCCKGIHSAVAAMANAPRAGQGLSGDHRLARHHMRHMGHSRTPQPGLRPAIGCVRLSARSTSV